MCKGLDYFSIDSYRDDPAAEVDATKRAYAPLIPKLHKPNPFEPRGQGLWVVPGLFWFMKGCDPAQYKQGIRGGAGAAGSYTPVCPNRTWCANGSQCGTSPTWEASKMKAWWAWAQTEPAIQGFNPWFVSTVSTVSTVSFVTFGLTTDSLIWRRHWRDRPTMSPPSNRRGAVSLGPEVLQWLMWVGGNITIAGRMKTDDAVSLGSFGSKNVDHLHIISVAATLLTLLSVLSSVEGASEVQNGVLTVDGSVIPAAGFYTYYESGLPAPSCRHSVTAAEASHGMRLVVPYVSSWALESTNISAGTREYLDRAAAVGVGVLLDMSSLTNLRGGGYPHKPQPPDLQTITHLVTSLKEHPAIIGWYTADEPDAGEGACE